MRAADLTVESIAESLRKRRTKQIISFGRDHRYTRQASVLIPMVVIDSEWHLLYTRRSDELTDHRGQVAFPGGAADPGDRDAVATALRETYEEIGVQPGDVRILGELDDYVTISEFLITPVVGTFNWPYPLTIQTAEVSRAFTIPLAWLARTENWNEQMYRTQTGEVHPVIFYEPYDGELLWGISARITVDFLHALGLIQA